jgi:hypothetical protein
MKAISMRQEKIIDELGNVVEIRMWQLPAPSKDKPHGYKYSLVYIVGGIRVIGYDNAEGQGDHRHIEGKTTPYHFVSLRKLANDFLKDVEKYKKR